MVNQSPAQTALSRAMIRWSIAKANPVGETEGFWLYRAEQTGRPPAALKILKADADESERRSLALLAWYGGEGVPAVFEVSGDAIFMEWLDGPPLAEPAANGRDDESSIALAQLVIELHRPRAAPPPPLMKLREHYEPLFRTARSGNWPGRARDLFARAIGITHGLFDRPVDEVVLHGALSHDCVFLSDRGWLAIDPAGLLGDATFEVAAAFMHPSDQPKLVIDPARIGRLADVFASRLGFNRKRILAFASTNAARSASVDLERGRPIGYQLAALPHLLTAYDQA